MTGVIPLITGIDGHGRPRTATEYLQVIERVGAEIAAGRGYRNRLPCSCATLDHQITSTVQAEAAIDGRNGAGTARSLDNQIAGIIGGDRTGMYSC